MQLPQEMQTVLRTKARKSSVIAAAVYVTDSYTQHGVQVELSTKQRRHVLPLRAQFVAQRVR